MLQTSSSKKQGLIQIEDKCKDLLKASLNTSPDQNSWPAIRITVHHEARTDEEKPG